MQKLFLQERTDRTTPQPRRCSPRASASKYGDRPEEELALVPSSLAGRFDSEDDGDSNMSLSDNELDEEEELNLDEEEVEEDDY